MHQADIIVIGGGIAGASAAAELARSASVILLETEDLPGYHATGRSAAFFAASYGKKIIRDMTRCCEDFFINPPAGFTDVPLIRLRDFMYFGRPDQAEQLKSMQQDNPGLEFVDADEVNRRVPLLRRSYLHSGLREPVGGDIDVDALLQGYVRQLRRSDSVLKTASKVYSLDRSSGQWRAETATGNYSAPVIVNAAGAWVDAVAVMAGLEPLGIQPLLRSAVLIDAPEGMDIDDWPMMIDADEDFYFKPDAGQIMISPGDETPSKPCDAQPDDFEIAVAIDRFERASGLDIRKVNQSWGGLRTFAPDRVFVAGFDPRCEGFFWLAGQGGYGVQSAPSMAKLTAFMVTGDQPEGPFEVVLEYAGQVAPDRFL